MTNMNKLLAAMAIGAIATAPAFAADITVPRTITTNTTWTSDNTYILTQYSFVTNGATLTIEPGTVVKGEVGTGANAPALIITRGSKIIADGSAESPIIFTSILDELNGNLTHEDVGLWGGVIVLGNATINSRANSQPAGTPAEDQVEGLAVSGSEAGFATFGGTDDDDDSGILRYVSIRHGGALIGGDNEINGLTLGGVGRSTTIEYIEVFGNKDDGIEWFGGTVNARYLVLAYGADDGIDFDQGYRGNIQFALIIGSDITDDLMDKGGEWDGSTSPLDATPHGAVKMANLTMIGVGDSLQPGGAPGRANTAINARDAVQVALYNSVFVNFAKMVDFEDDLTGPVGSPIFAFPGDYDWQGNVWWSHISENNTPAGLNARPGSANNPEAFFAAPYGEIANPQLGNIGYGPEGALDPFPAAGSPAASGAADNSELDEWFIVTSYKGAFAPGGNNWAYGWTKLSQDGYFAEEINNPGKVGWEEHPTYGWVYYYGGVPGWVWFNGIETFGYIFLTEEGSGTYVYLLDTE